MRKSVNGLKISKPKTKQKQVKQKDLSLNVQSVELPDHTPTLIISEDLQTQINYNHRNYDKERIGELIVTSNNKVLKDLVLEAHFMHTTNVGTETFTSKADGSTSSDIMSTIVKEYPDNEELLINHMLGNIHTHHNMDTFFSGTDTHDLKENAMLNAPGYYVSLIVNYKGVYNAKLAYKTKRKMTYTDSLLSGETEQDIIIIATCNIQFENNVSDDYKQRFEKLVKAFNKPTTKLLNTEYQQFLKGFGFADDFPIIPKATHDLPKIKSLGHVCSNCGKQFSITGVAHTSDYCTYCDTSHTRVTANEFIKKFTIDIKKIKEVISNIETISIDKNDIQSSLNAMDDIMFIWSESLNTQLPIEYSDKLLESILRLEIYPRVNKKYKQLILNYIQYIKL